MHLTKKCAFCSVCRRGFTLVELLVVMGIIGVLSAVLLMSIGKTSDSARAAKCLFNMRTLALGANSIAMSSRWYPFGGSFQHITTYRNQISHYECVGWVSWLSMSHPFGGHPRNPVAVQIPTFDLDFANDDGAFALTNGTMWRAVNKNRSVYLCPEHALAYQRANSGRSPLWSYVMNSYFAYDYSQGKRAVGYGMRREYGKLKNAERILMFAELPINDPESGQPMTYANDAMKDPTLQYNASVQGKKLGASWNGTPEFMGFNHTTGRKEHCGHVAFADGHVETLMQPKGTGGLTVQELTAVLCEGLDYSFDGNTYELLEGTY